MCFAQYFGSGGLQDQYGQVDFPESRAEEPRSRLKYPSMKRSHTLLVLKEMASNVLQIGRVPVSALQAGSGEL